MKDKGDSVLLPRGAKTGLELVAPPHQHCASALWIFPVSSWLQGMGGTTTGGF
jgi:hypothetical protein